MNISSEQLKEFKELYRQRFGEEITDEQAQNKAEDLLQLMKNVYQPIRKSDAKKFLENIND